MNRVGEFRPGNETIWVVVDEEFYFLGPTARRICLA